MFGIYYCEGEVFDAIAGEVDRRIKQISVEQFHAKYNDQAIIDLLGDKILKIEEKSFLLERIHLLINIREIETEEDLLRKAETVIEQIANFEALCKKLSFCNGDKIIELTSEKESFFEIYQKGAKGTDEEIYNEYLIYQEVLPFYYSTLYNKKKTRLKPSIEKLDEYVDFAKKAIELLIENQLVIKNGEELEYNNHGDINGYIEGIKLLLSNQ